MEVPLPPSNEELPIFTGRSDLIVRVPEPLSIAPVSEAPQELLKLKEDKPELERLQNIQGKPERAKQPQGAVPPFLLFASVLWSLLSKAIVSLSVGLFLCQSILHCA